MIRRACGKGAVVFKRHAAEHIPGGEYYDWTDEQRAEVSCAPPTNDACESRMGTVQGVMHAAPGITEMARDGIMKCTFNRTIPWLRGFSPEMKERYIQAVIKITRETCQGEGAKP